MPYISPQKLFSFSTFLSFSHAAKWLDQKDKFNFKFYDVTARLTNNCNIHIAQCLKSEDNQATKFDQLIECNMRNIFIQKSYTKCDGETSPRLFSEKLKLSISLDK